MKQVMKKLVVLIAITAVAALGVWGITKIAGCGKNKNIAIFTYAAVEEKEDCIIITGLTDKGKTDSEITIPSQIDGKKAVSIGREAFRDCANLKEVTIEDGITEIAENAFFNCTNLEKINVPKSVEKIGTNAIKNTKWHTKISDAEFIVINDILIEVVSKKEVYVVPKEVKRVASGVFYNNKSVKQVSLPDGINHIESYAFAGCENLEKVNLPNSIIEIEYGAFSGCSNLSVEVPENVRFVGIDAFFNVASLKYNGSLKEAPWGAKSYAK